MYTFRTPTLVQLLVVTLLVLATAGCVRFQPVTLYTGVEQAPLPERPRSLALVVEPTVYDDQTDDTIWFQDDTRCTQGRLTEEVVYGGERAIEVSWDRNTEGCEWAGLGVGWDGWVGKDLSPLLPYAAFEMRVRAREGTMYGLPIVLTLEDYAGGMGFAYTDNRYFERPVIDEEWQKVVVPLAAFDMDVENLDPTNVKQLMFELQQSGSIYLDDIRLVFYEEAPQEPWLEEAPRPDPTALPIQLFGDAFINDNGWGLVTDACQSIEITTQDASSGSAALRLQWDVTPADCYQAALGVSWDRWHPVDLTAVAPRMAVQFEAKLPTGTATDLPVRIGFEDYDRNYSAQALEGRYTPAGRFTETWQTVTIPVADFTGTANFGNIKHLVLYLNEAGALLIDNLRLVALD